MSELLRQFRACASRMVPTVADMTERVLAQGENMPLPAAATRLQVLIGWEDVTGETDIDGSALLLNRDRQVV